MSKVNQKKIDHILLSLVVLMVAIGFMIFSSAALGLMSRSGVSFTSAASGQFVFGVLGGGLAMFIVSNIYYRHWRKYAFYIFLFTIILTLMVFTPLGMSHGGATRWLNLGITTLQPSEFLKLGLVIYLATWLSGVHNKINRWRYGLVPFGGIVGLVAIVMLIQPDTDSFLIVAFASLAMYLTAGARWRDIMIIAVLGITLLAVVAMVRPYIMDRLTNFIHPEADPQGTGYQVQQSLIAIGSGGITGRGFGQSIQKFQYLPEPTSDSIYAVYGEEFGFVGSLFLISLFIFIALRGYRIATKTTDIFGTLLIVGFMTMIIGQAFLNIAAMLAIAPLSGLPLPFISHGGTALMATLASIGIVLNVSKYRKTR